jgi:hypothetical protein
VVSLAGGHARKALTGEEPYPYQHFGYREIGREESGATTHELASCELQQAPLESGLGHSVVVAWGERSSFLVLFAQGSFPKDLWIDLKRDSNRESERADMARRG